jgi:hypothetical protein
VTSFVFPFGRPLIARPPVADGPRPLFILGAYPSAFHVAWRPPAASGLASIKAVAVDNEPEPFWTGADEPGRLISWKHAVEFDGSPWGEVDPVGKLNGSSGRWLDEQILGPLRHSRAETWITDCLDVYSCSSSLRQRLIDTYDRMPGLPHWDLPEHPSEDDIVRQSIAHHTARLRSELAAARPLKIITLGNAALRVLARLVDDAGSTSLPKRLSADAAGYGQPLLVHVHGRSVAWLPLAHPAAPKLYQDSHKAWLATFRAP